MKKLNTSPISGMQELLPPRQAIFDKFKAEICEVYRSHGYQHIETPTIDRSEVLLAKAGGDTEKQIYKVIKTAESAEDADQALRFDHTVPLARYVVEHENDLPFPFKVTQVGRNYRGERAQRGRFREFYQCDIDVVGRGQLPLAYDADVISTLMEALGRILAVAALEGDTTRVLARVSNRKIWSGLFEALNLQEYGEKILGIVDHAEKVAPEKTLEALRELGLTEESVVKITTLMQIRGTVEEVRGRFSELGVSGAKFDEGVDELMTVLGLLGAQGLNGSVTADLMIVRGLDYYTGTVFEFVLPEYREIGSVCGGGRYDNLAGHFTDQALPGVGGSIGLTRLFYVLGERGMLTASAVAPVDIMLMPISAAEYEYCAELAKRLRAEGKSVDIDFSEKRLGDRFQRAAKIAREAIVIGENEVATGNYVVKTLG